MIEQMGGVDIFIPGVSAGGGADSERNWWKSFEVDVLSTVRGCEAVIEHMKESGGGAITFITTSASVETFGGPQAYNAMKGSLLVYAKQLSQDVGKDNIRYIKSDEQGRINIDAFKNQVEDDIANGFVPFYINATAGTTVLCAFDNVDELAPICKKNNIWLHLDGAFGGSVIFSKKYNHLVKGIEQTDSFCFNAHKTLGAPLLSLIHI